MSDIWFYKKSNEHSFNFGLLREGIVVWERELKKNENYEEPIHYVIVLDTSFSSSQEMKELAKVQNDFIG